MTIEKWALLTGGTAVLVAVTVWWGLRRRARRRRIPRFEGKLGHGIQNREFVDFLTKYSHRRVRLDVWLDEGAVADPGQPTDQLRLLLPNDDPRLSDECEITIRVDDRRITPLSHEHGIWRLNGYVTVEGRTGVWQGIPSYHLVAIPRRPATN